MILHLIFCFLGGLFLANAVPHVVSGVLGRPFQTPFAKPSGIGLSSSTVNVWWGAFNLLLAWLLLCRASGFEPRDAVDAACAGLGALLISLFAARHFGALHGGRAAG